jgi:D-arabinose 1-dehydrogenase-like Zn-dependent alcohol dehydrogenase
VQFAAKMGFHTVAIARGRDKEKLALDLGAHRYIDSETEDAAAALTALGGAKTILATVTSGKAMTPLIDGLGIDGTLIVVGASPEPIEVNPFHIIGARRGVRGWPSGTSVDSEDTMRFSALTGVAAMIETFPLARAAEAYERMLSGKARFRVVIVP